MRRTASKFAKIPASEMVGMRAPQFALNSDVTFEVCQVVVGNYG